MRFSILGGGGKTVDPRDYGSSANGPHCVQGNFLGDAIFTLTIQDQKWTKTFVTIASVGPQNRPSLWQTLWLNFDFCLNQKKTSTGTLKKTQKPQVIQAMTCSGPVYPLVAGHLTFPKGHVVFTSPTRSPTFSQLVAVELQQRLSFAGCKVQVVAGLHQGIVESAPTCIAGVYGL